MKRLFAALLVVLLASPQLWGYSEDQLGQDPHSTFHYNLVRTLAAAAGFGAADAEAIADACEATDRGTFSGVVLTGTERPDAHQGQQSLGLYYHFGRRGAQNATGDYDLPGDGTCQYFTAAHVASKSFASTCPYRWLTDTAGASGEPGPCQVEDDGQTLPETSEIELWAVYGRGLPRFGAPTIAKNGSAAQPVAARSLDALGIYLHALADSYSHEACMEQCSFQGHSVGPASCTAVYWHEIAEYGPPSLQNSGTSYTRNAAQAVWLTLKSYRQVNGLTGPAKWTDQQAQSFWDTWIALDTGAEREEAANAAFTELTQ
jgi:hypothetical protein